MTKYVNAKNVQNLILEIELHIETNNECIKELEDTIKKCKVELEKDNFKNNKFLTKLRGLLDE